LVIISVIVELYFVIKYDIIRNRNIILGGILIVILISTVIVWISNKLCYNYNWILYVIIALLVISIIDNVTTLSDPLKREKIISEFQMDEETFMKYRK